MIQSGENVLRDPSPADRTMDEGGDSGPARRTILELEQILALRSSKSDADIKSN